MIVTVRFIGSFCNLSGRKIANVRLKRSCSMEDLVKVIVSDFPDMGSALVDSESGRLKSNVIMLVNGKDLSALSGFGTNIKNGDEVVLVPIVHGG